MTTTSDANAATAGWWRRAVTSRVGAVALSWDVFGVPIGIAIALPTALNEDVSKGMGSAFIAACGIAAAIATLVITAMTVLIGVVGPNYRLLLANVTGGVAGILRPYRIVAILAVLASLTSLCLGVVWPLVVTLPWGLTWACAAVPLALLAWSLLGCIQVVVQVAHHFSNNQRAEQLAAEVAQRRRGA